MAEAKTAEPLIREYKLRLMRPKCSPNLEGISAFADIDTDISEVIPYLHGVIKGAVYAANMPALTFHHKGHMVTVQPHMIGVSKCANEEEAERMIKWLVDLINDTWRRRSEIEPNYDEVQPLSVLDVYQLLPGINCGRCGESTCLAFAAKLVAGDAKIEQCEPLLKAPQFSQKAMKLLDELIKRGYEVPEGYL